MNFLILAAGTRNKIVQYFKKTLGEGISGESLNVLIGSMPVENEKISNGVKLHAIQLINEKYGITEADLMSAELTFVPAKAPSPINSPLISLPASPVPSPLGSPPWIMKFLITQICLTAFLREITIPTTLPPILRILTDISEKADSSEIIGTAEVWITIPAITILLQLGTQIICFYLSAKKRIY